MRICRLHNKGFSLVEVIVASIILSSAVVTVTAISSRSLNAVSLDNKYEKAAALLDRQLTIIDSMGITEFINMGRTQGDFGKLAPGFSWQASTEHLGLEDLYKLTLCVNWTEHNRPKQIKVITRLNGNGLLNSLTNANNQNTAK
jgi:prepilin-type N-terminal cleavage/methylation domain-containing protein